MQPGVWICLDVIGDNVQWHGVQNRVATLPHSYLVSKLWANVVLVHGDLGKREEQVKVANGLTQLVEEGNVLPHLHQQLVQHCIGDV